MHFIRPFPKLKFSLVDESKGDHAYIRYGAVHLYAHTPFGTAYIISSYRKRDTREGRVHAAYYVAGALHDEFTVNLPEYFTLNDTVKAVDKCVAFCNEHYEGMLSKCETGEDEGNEQPQIAEYVALMNEARRR